MNYFILNIVGLPLFRVIRNRIILNIVNIAGLKVEIKNNKNPFWDLRKR